METLPLPIFLVNNFASTVFSTWGLFLEGITQWFLWDVDFMYTNYCNLLVPACFLKLYFYVTAFARLKNVLVCTWKVVWPWIYGDIGIIKIPSSNIILGGCAYVSPLLIHISAQIYELYNLALWTYLVTVNDIGKLAFFHSCAGGAGGQRLQWFPVTHFLYFVLQVCLEKLWRAPLALPVMTM